MHRNRQASPYTTGPMCLIVLAHRASVRHPFVLAANRDELYARPTLPTEYWPDAPDVFGGRDAVAGGSWLAVTRAGRFAAVTNLRGALPAARSRGELVRGFVTSRLQPLAYARSLDPARYAGFHLLAGEAGGDIVYLTGSGDPEVLEPGIHAFSNAPIGEHWPKEQIAIDAMTLALTSDDVTGEMLAFLTTPRNSGSVESEVFIRGELYGTRASTVVAADRRSLSFIEQPSAGARVAEVLR